MYTDDPDAIGVKQGVTTIIDAGSCGANDIDDFYRLAQTYQTNVYSLINVAKIGIPFQGELLDRTNLDLPLVTKKLQQYSDFILGIKIRMSSSVVGDNGLWALQKTVAWQETTKIPMMVHIGNAPPDITSILATCGQQVIISHAYHGKANRIFNRSDDVIKVLLLAQKRGVKLDVGHGSESFSFKTFTAAIKAGFYPDFISSDLYQRNRLQGPVFSLAAVLSKMLSFGLPLASIIEKVTITPTNFFNLKKIGKLEQDYIADLTFFQVKPVEITVFDNNNEKNPRTLSKIIEPQMCFTKNKLIDLRRRKDENTK
ncbi:amidohydrolase family protein [Spiroplasma sp. SV19]|uniref:amidohydrolase family protein n=1 Tax=Spiroplasma sp. SV19 TaxID=2570468 RepID=UPI0024B69491|nr:amidohydrolase family protein [Spiroplasma sp. SV19]WHQ37448.1 amidohydrolase family protein [Spiroplasma sp. SV19]